MSMVMRVIHAFTVEEYIEARYYQCEINAWYNS